jgi:hypothetical protein
LKLLNFLQSMLLGASGVPLHCVICKDLHACHHFASPAEASVHECPLNGLFCTEDNPKVCDVFKQSVADAQNWDWIKTPHSGQERGAVTLLRTHFDGPGEVKKGIAHARNSMEGLHCTKESIFPFSSCITRLRACHATLAQAHDEASNCNKVAKTLKGTTTVNLSLIVAMQTIRSDPNAKNNFTSASSKLSKQIALIFPVAF